MGIYLNSQYPDTDDPAARLAELVGQVRLAESGGFDSIWAGEHHLTSGFHFFPQLALLSHLVPYSGRMTLGTNVLLLPMHRPVDVAEQVAFIDVACGGRFILGAGLGYRREEFAALGVPFEERVPRMVEGISVMRRLWRETGVDHDDSWFTLKDATLRPGPASADGPPIWIGGTTDKAIRRAAHLGDGFVAGSSASNDDVRRQVELFLGCRAELGLRDRPEVGRMLEVYCHEDTGEARRRAAPHLLTKYASYASWGLTGSAGTAARSAGAVTGQEDFAALAADRFVIGDPDEVVAGLLHQYRHVGITHLAMRLAWPGSAPTDTLACIELLGNEILPRVRAELS
ncbi:MAG: LLM class flavin-dependent oxidoreductase [Nocardiopsaceae bacterium]|nr:LLM class flavin-dependent oxidoreductase [Nocardiopsaceae bacterium]